MSRKASFFVSADGADVTGNFSLDTTDISITDSSGASADTATIKLDDRESHIVLPPLGTAITIGIGWGRPVILFDGFVDDVDWDLSRGGGRNLSISCKSADTLKGKLKEPQEKHEDETTLGAVAKKWGEAAGIGEVFVHPDLASIERQYWSMNNESFLAWGERMAKANGATFKVLGDRAVMVPRSAGVSASGQPLVPIIAQYGVNLISANIKPMLARPQAAKFRARHFDVKAGDWLAAEVESTYDTEAEAVLTARYSEADEGAGKARAGSNEKESDRERGGGSISIDGEPNAQAEAPCILIGARPGVDGEYRIDSVTHSYNRGGGFVSALSVKQPGGDAGKDDRGESGTAAPTPARPDWLADA